MNKHRMRRLSLLGCYALASVTLHGAPLGDPLPPTDLAISLSDGPDPVGVIYWTLTYFATATNLGAAAATNVRVTIPFVPSAVELSPVSAPCVLEAAAVVCLYETLAPGASVSSEVAMTLRSSAPALLAPTAATVAADNPDPVPGNDSASVSTTIWPVVGARCDPTAVEGDSGTTSATCYARLLGPPHAQPVVASYSFEGGTAVPNVDFLMLSGDVTFPPGVEDRDLEGAVFGDTTVEGYDSFRIRISAASNAFPSPNPPWTYIVNDDIGNAGDLSRTGSPAPARYLPLRGTARPMSSG